MITTSLAQSQKLKEWGMPQDTYFMYDLVTEILMPFSIAEEGFKYVSAPTLGELIDFLGEKFLYVERHNAESLVYDGEAKGVWMAKGRPYLEATSEEKLRVWGNTPLDALFALVEQIKGEND